MSGEYLLRFLKDLLFSLWLFFEDIVGVEVFGWFLMLCGGVECFLWRLFWLFLLLFLDIFDILERLRWEDVIVISGIEVMRGLELLFGGVEKGFGGVGVCRFL